VSAISAEVFESDRRLLWGLCYRMTGNAADADDLVQETFVRAIEKPPRRTDEPVRPWLIRVAINLSRDCLRRRRRRGYVGPWLPSPIPTGDLEQPASYEPPAPSEDSPMARYDLLESVTFAFLLALEALTPSQRAILLLRDVLDYSTREAAEALGLTEANAKVLLHRARQKMQDYDKSRINRDAAEREATRKALEQFLYFLSTRNVEGLERLLAEEVISISDGGGEVYAALKPIYGREKVMRLILGLSEKIGPASAVAFRMLNGLPAIVSEQRHAPPGSATRFVLSCRTDAAGHITRLDAVVAPSKLTAV